MGNKGETVVDIAVKLGTCKESIRQWAQEHPEFLVSLKACRTRSEMFMKQIGMSGMLGRDKQQIPDFKPAMWIFWMKARFGWRDDGANETDLPGDRPELEFTE